MTPSIHPDNGHPLTREAWLLQAASLLRGLFEEKGMRVPNFLVSVGIPATSRRGSAVGQCWRTTASGNGVNQVFVSPVLADAVEVMDTLVHEMVHVLDNCEHGHGKEFKKIATRVGLVGKMREASAGEPLRLRLQEMAAELAKAIGPYPHSPLNLTPAPIAERPKPARAKCEHCGFKFNMPRRFLHYAPPACPLDAKPMVREGEWE